MSIIIVYSSCNDCYSPLCGSVDWTSELLPVLSSNSSLCSAAKKQPQRHRHQEVQRCLHIIVIQVVVTVMVNCYSPLCGSVDWTKLLPAFSSDGSLYSAATGTRRCSVILAYDCYSGYNDGNGGYSPLCGSVDWTSQCESLPVSSSDSSLSS